MEHDIQACFKRNIHNRTLDDIEVLAARFFTTPEHHIQLDATTLLQNAAITDVQMEDVSDDVVMVEDDVQEAEVRSRDQTGIARGYTGSFLSRNQAIAVNS